MIKGQKVSLWIWILLFVAIILVVGGIYWLISTRDNPTLFKNDVVALVKYDLMALGIQGHNIESVDQVSEVKYIGNKQWEGEAIVSYSYIKSFSRLHIEFENGETIRKYGSPQTETIVEEVKIKWRYFEKLNLTEIL